MIVYSGTKKSFSEDVISNQVVPKILAGFGHSVPDNQVRAFQNSLNFVHNILLDTEIPEDSGVSIEYQIPQSSKRIDFILTGRNEQNIEHAVLIELKQWSKAKITEKDGIVRTFVGKSESEHAHPSYQAWSYAALLNGFNATVYDENIELKPCAYLHNYEDDNVIRNSFYSEYLEKAPIFLRDDALKLRDFIKKYVKYGDTSNTMYRIDNGKIRPSKSLADSLASMLRGNSEFVMIDDQKIVYETVLGLARKVGTTMKNVVIVHGGPGTGKSVVAVNLLVALTKMGLLAKYVSKNAAPRTVYESMLTGVLRKTEISNLFSGSGSFITTERDSFDTLIVDEAHRLNEKSGLYGNLGVNQIKEIIFAAKCSIFFIDEDQKVTLNDIGEKEEIRKWAEKEGAVIHELELPSQFRCNGSDGYLAWLDDVLQIHPTANVILDDKDYDFKIVDTPNELESLIFEKNKERNKARMVAGYCWNWAGKKNPTLKDIKIPQYNFEAKWNLATDGNLWLIKPESVKEVGCIHTCQGLEVDYVGVIVGNDLTVRDGLIVTDVTKRAKTDASIKGYKKRMEGDPLGMKRQLDSIIKNTYRTLMTRAMKGCYVFFEDKETREHFASHLRTKFAKLAPQRVISPITVAMVQVPLVGSAPCGDPLLGETNIEDYIPVEKSKIKSGFQYFILRANGDSMNQAGINDGDLVLCRQQLKAETGDRVVALLGDNVTIKEYGARENGVRKLLPKSSNPGHQPITPNEGDSVQGVVQEVLVLD